MQIVGFLVQRFIYVIQWNSDNNIFKVLEILKFHGNHFVSISKTTMAATTDKIYSFFTFDRPSNQSYKPMNARLVE